MRKSKQLRVYEPHTIISSDGTEAFASELLKNCNSRSPVVKWLTTLYYVVRLLRNMSPESC